MSLVSFSFSAVFLHFFLNKIVFSVVGEGELVDEKSTQLQEDSVPPLALVRKQFNGRYAISSEEFTSEMVRF